MKLPPSRIRINGDVYKAVVLLVNTRDMETGAPRLCTLIPDNHHVDLEGGEEMFICYAPEEELDPR